MTGTERKMPRYGAQDLAVYPLVLCEDTPPALVEHLDWGLIGPDDRAEIKVADAIIETYAVGYGGHFYEVLEDSVEGEVLRALADHLAPKYQLTWQQAYDLLEQIRSEYARRVLLAMKEVDKTWRRQGFAIETRNGPDRCPTCGTWISDSDIEGCEAPDGQRWCLAHALDALVAYRPRPGETI